jgi:hypothetical protein
MKRSATHLTRRRALARASAAALAPLLAAPASGLAQAAPPLVQVWKSPTCGCCKDWVAHLEAHGFRVQVHEVGNTAARARLKVPAALGSCHTAQVGRYAIEGHVPAADILQLLKQQPDAIGLTVPGMPIGSPGMDGPAHGGRRDPFDVLLIAGDGSTRVFSRHFNRHPQPKGRA